MQSANFKFGSHGRLVKFIVMVWLGVVCYLVCSLDQHVWAISFEEARHLLSRTSFGVDLQSIQSISGKSYKSAVDHLVNDNHKTPDTQPPQWALQINPYGRPWRNLNAAERQELRRMRRRQAMEIKAWWFREAVMTTAALAEKMTLFWHNHFTSSMRKVKVPPLLYHQNLLLRRHALGNFRELVVAIAKDPAMLIYLDNVANRKGKPNENFARELLELFTLGEGHYTEKDIKEAARAFTGWTLNRRTGNFQFAVRRHDFGHKTFMGYNGRFNGDDILSIILDQKQVANHMVQKLWYEFVSVAPRKTEILQLAELFRSTGYEIKPVIHAILQSKAFRAQVNIGTQIKSPVELIVGTMRTFEISPGDGYGLAMASRRLGQDVMDPPNVKGWPGGVHWITSDALLARSQILDRFLRGKEMAPQAARWRKMNQMASSNHHTNHTIGKSWRKLTPLKIAKIILAAPPVQPLDDSQPARKMIAQLMMDPVYQLK